MSLSDIADGTDVRLVWYCFPMSRRPGASKDRQQSISALARRQHGLLTREQAKDLGLSASAIARRLSSGAWARVLPRVFADAHAPETQFQRIKAAELWAGEGAAISHRSALSLW